MDGNTIVRLIPLYQAYMVDKRRRLEAEVAKLQRKSKAPLKLSAPEGPTTDPTTKEVMPIEGHDVST